MEYISIHKPTIIAGSYVLLFLSVYALDSLLIDGVVIEKKIKVDDSEILIFEKRVGFKVCVYEEDKHQRLTFFRGNQRKEKVIKEIESLKIRHNFE